MRMNHNSDPELVEMAQRGCSARLMRLRRKKLPTFSIDRPIEYEDGQGERQVIDPGPDARADVLQQELREMIRRTVSRLSSHHRNVVDLRLVDGLSTDETAERLGLSAAVVKFRLHRARLIPRAELAPYVEPGQTVTSVEAGDKRRSCAFSTVFGT